MSKFKVFIQQSKFESEILQNAILENVEVYENENKLMFKILLDDVVEVRHLRSFLTNLESYFLIPNVVKNIEYKLIYKKSENFPDYFQQYYDFAVKEISKKRPRLEVLATFKARFEDNLIYVIVDKDSKYIGRYCAILENKFRQLGFNFKVELEIDESIKKMSEVIKEELETQDEIAAQKEAIDERNRKKETIRTKSYNSGIKASPVSISEIPLDEYRLSQYLNEKGPAKFIIEGEVFNHEIRPLRNASKLLIFTVADKDDSIVCKKFLNNERDEIAAESIKLGDYVKLEGNAQFDSFIKDMVIMVSSFEIINKPKKIERLDKEKIKRVELHTHTKMSNMDGIGDVEDYFLTAEKWGHKALAITDHNGLYSFPDIAKITKNLKIKPIYGVEFNFVDDYKFKIATGNLDMSLRDISYVVFDIETTGLSITRDRIIEIGAVKVVSGVITNQYQTFVNPHEKLSGFITNLTGIRDEDVENAPDFRDVIPEFLEFCKGSVLVAHNAIFDIGHIEQAIKVLELPEQDFKIIDTLNLSRYFYSDKLKRFNLKAVSRYFKVALDNHHRAGDDAKATAEIFIMMLQDLYKLGIENFDDINKAISPKEGYKHIIPSHINLLVKNQLGYKNLFILSSEALTTNFYNEPRLLKSVLNKYREGILVGSGCVNGEVFETALNRSDNELEEVIKYYDYIEVQPPAVYEHLIEGLGENGHDIIKATITKIINFTKNQNKLVVATGDVHYLEKEDQIFRDIYIRTPLVGGGIHELSKYDTQPIQYFLTTTEMLKAFDFLPEETAKEIVVTNTNVIADSIDKIKAFPTTLYSLNDDVFKDLLGVESISKEVKRIVYENLEKKYGTKVHPLILKRVEQELQIIINNKFAPIYYISYILVQKSVNDGYIVGSRGSVGSSFIATLLQITEVNPLRPHYYCENKDFTVLKFSKAEIEEYGITEEEKAFQAYFENIKSGYDLPNMCCPICGGKLYKDGHDIPFETFIGFSGEKVPDIDLNFSGDYQAVAHAYVRELLGEDYTFRAGTIQKVQERNAFGYVKGYLEDKNLDLRKAQVDRLARKIQGVKRSSGQHPGGIVVVPKDYSIFDVTPIQYPADDVNADWKTTHFDYDSFSDNLLKLDILGHDNPTILKFLMDYVHKHQENFDFKHIDDIPLDDQEVYKMFQGNKVLGINATDLDCDVASYGIPEFGTPFVRQMLCDTKPDSFSGLVKISGLSHGKNVWLNNGQALIKGEWENVEKVSFDNIIACRDDIMVVLTNEYHLEPIDAFNIMEFIRKGKPSEDPKKWLEHIELMRKYNIPEWYIKSAGLINYLFPKAHATAYVIVAMRIAWFKLYQPLLFYSAFFSIRSVQFDHEVMVAGANAIRNKLKKYEETRYGLTNKDLDLQTTLGVALEMAKRGYKFLPVDINKSAATEFTIEGKALRMPFVSVDGLGLTAANDIVARREEKAFSTREDVRTRTKINKTVFEKLEEYGSFNDLKSDATTIDTGLFAFEF